MDSTVASNDVLWTDKQVAAYLGRTPRCVRRWRLQGFNAREK